MEIVLLLLPVAILLATGAVIAFLWASRRGQFDDLETPGIRVLFDDDRASGQVENNASVGQERNESAGEG